MKMISVLFLILIVMFSLTGCACNYWQLTAQHQPVNKQWKMSVCADWVHKESTITEESYDVVIENANHLLQTSENTELHECHVIPGSIRFSRGAYIVMQIDCNQPLRGVEWLHGSIPKQYIIELQMKRGQRD